MIFNRIKHFINAPSSRNFIIKFPKKILFSLIQKLKINHLNKFFRKSLEKYSYG